MKQGGFDGMLCTVLSMEEPMIAANVFPPTDILPPAKTCIGSATEPTLPPIAFNDVSPVVVIACGPPTFEILPCAVICTNVAVIGATTKNGPGESTITPPGSI